MSYYHIKNIKIDRENNYISADLADSCWQPLDWFHVDNLCDKDTFKEKYANFIYNLVSGNFHPSSNNKYSKIVMNNYLKNYYDDAHDIGELETFYKYQTVVNAILRNDFSKVTILPSDREIRPHYYYDLLPFYVTTKYNLSYYKNEKGELFGYDGEKLYCCVSLEKNYGYPISIPLDNEKFKEYNAFLNDKHNNKNDIEKDVEIDI